MSHGVCRQPPGVLYLSTRGPWLGQRGGHGVDRPKPGEGVGGGEGEAGEIREETETHPMVVFLGLGVAGLEVPRGAVAPAATASGGGGVPVG